MNSTSLKIWAGALSLLGFTFSTNATVWTVTSLADSGSGSLRAQVAASATDDTIQFAVSGKILLNSAINITHSLNLQGPGPALLIVDANHVDRAFVTSGAVTNVISGMTITNGYVAGSPGANGSPGQSGVDGSAAYGGAILDHGMSLILSNCWLVGNTVVGGTGGEGGYNLNNNLPGSGGSGGLGEGGAVYSESQQVGLVNCTFSDNSAIGGVGGIGGSNAFVSVQYGGTGGQGGGGQAGAIQSSAADMTGFTNCTFSGNRAEGGVGGMGGFNAFAFGGQGGSAGDAGGGAIASAYACGFRCCTIVSNVAVGGTGGSGGSGASLGANGANGSATGGGVVGYVLTCNNPIENTILADNYSSGVASNYFMAFNDNGHNFIGSDDYSSCLWASNTLVGTVAAPIHPQLSPLAQNGGGLPTHATTLTSPVTDAGSGLGQLTDERGAPRPYDFASIPNASGGDGSDIGAFELGSTDLGFDIISGNVVVSWPAYYGDFLLQSATSLQGSNNWSNVLDAPVVIGNQLVITNPIVGPIRFYRLVSH